MKNHGVRHDHISPSTVFVCGPKRFGGGGGGIDSGKDHYKLIHPTVVKPVIDTLDKYLQKIDNYLAPEFIGNDCRTKFDNRQDNGAEVYSLGVLLLEISCLTKQTQFYSHADSFRKESIAMNMKHMKNLYGSNLYNLISKMIEEDPNKRIKM